MFTVDVVIAAAGSGKRMGAGRNKLLLNLQEEKEVLLENVKIEIE